jgi:membrane fusion protein (multidrug efflux system)
MQQISSTEQSLTRTKRRASTRVMKTLLAASLSLFLAAIVAGWLVRGSGLYEATDDAQIDGHIMHVSARVKGPVEKINVVEGQLVHAGDVIALIDPGEYKIALSETLSDLASAEDEAASCYLNVAITIARSYGNLGLAQAEVQTAEAAMAAAGSVSSLDVTEFVQAREQLLHARANLGNALTAPEQVSLAKTQALAADSEVMRQKGQVERSQLNFSNTVIRSPVAGIVGKIRLEVGQNATFGQELVDIVPFDDVWVTANFKETQLAHIKPGQPVEIKVDAYGRKWKGHVTTLGGAANSVFSPVPLTKMPGKYVKVTQRVPVRIDFDRVSGQEFNAGGLLKPGLSVEPGIIVRPHPRVRQIITAETR